MTKHDFLQAAKSFRAGRISLQQFAETVLPKIENTDRSSWIRENSDASNSVPPDSVPPDSVPPDSVPPDSGPPNSVPSDYAPEVSQHSAALAQALPRIEDRRSDCHKGDFGRVLLVGGSVGMAGAISLSSLAALRMGSGLVKVAVPAEILPTVAQFSPCYMTIPCICENGQFHGAALDAIQRDSRWANVLAVGPGMGRGPAQDWIVPQLYAKAELPIVVDADAINSLASTKADLSNHAGPRILTPHPGEFQRLLDCKTMSRNEMEEQAKELAIVAGVVIVLKGNRTLVTDGQHHYHNQTGNPGMATAGAGDVLTGVITSLIGQGFEPFDAASLGVHLHGLAGDMAAESRGQSSLIASDLIEYLGAATKFHSARSRTRIGFAAS